MRRTGHIRERSPGHFELRYSLGTDPATGKRRMITTTVRCSRKEEARRELSRLLRARDTGEHVDPHRMTVREWLTTWLASVREQVAPKTHERYGEIVNHFLIPELGNLHLVKLAPAHIQEAHNRWAAGGRRDGKNGGLSPRTRRLWPHRQVLTRARDLQQPAFGIVVNLVVRSLFAHATKKLGRIMSDPCLLPQAGYLVNDYSH